MVDVNRERSCNYRRAIAIIEAAAGADLVHAILQIIRGIRGNARRFSRHACLEVLSGVRINFLPFARLEIYLAKYKTAFDELEPETWRFRIDEIEARN